MLTRKLQASLKLLDLWLTQIRLWYGYRIWGIEYVSREVRSSFHRVRLLQKYGAIIGESVCIHPELSIHDAKGDFCNLVIGSNVSISRGVLLDLSARIEIEDNVGIGMRAMLFTHRSFVRSSALEKVYPLDIRTIRVSHDVMIGAHAVILPGVTINPCSVVAPGAVVSTDVPSYSLIVGNPSRVVSRIEGIGT